jgi:cytochrome c oxidase subunit 2
MRHWSQFGLQDAYSPVIEEFQYFHDFTNMILLFVLVYVGHIMASITVNSIVNKGLLEGQLIECVWTIIPGLILIQIALPSLSLLYLLEDSPYADFTLKAIGHQWYWEYEYCDCWAVNNKQTLIFDSYMTPETELESGMFRQLDVDNRVVLPLNRQIRVLVTSGDVLHSWTVPSLGVKADAIPGRLNQVNFLAVIPGVLYGQCSEICGRQHSRMPISLEIVPYSKFGQWLERAWRLE